MYKALIPAVRGDYPHVNAALCGKCQRRDHAVIDYQIRRVDVKIAFGASYHLKINMLANVVKIHRAVGIRLDVAVTRQVIERVGLRHIPRNIVLSLAARKSPHLKEHHRKAPCGVSAQHDTGVLPVTEALARVYILVGKVHASRKRHITVDDAYLAVITVVLKNGEKRRERIEHTAPDARRFKLRAVILRKEKKAADVVIHHAHLNALCGFLLQHVKYGIPHLALLHDKILHKDVFLRLFKLLEQPRVIFFARRKKVGSRAVPYRKARKFFKIPYLRKVLRQRRGSLVIAAAPLERGAHEGRIYLAEPLAVDKR